jgi:hypothetical protein
MTAFHGVGRPVHDKESQRSDYSNATCSHDTEQRHCPRCQTTSQNVWKRKWWKELYQVTHAHVHITDNITFDFLPLLVAASPFLFFGWEPISDSMTLSSKSIAAVCRSRTPCIHTIPPRNRMNTHTHAHIEHGTHVNQSSSHKHPSV